MSVKVESDKRLARVATNLAIGVVGLVVIRLITQLLPMFHDAGWIVEDKLTVQAGAVIAIDALLVSVLVRFGIEIRAYLLLRFPAISAFGNRAASLVCLIITTIAYTDFKPVTHAWPDVSGIYLWTFFAIAVAFLIAIVALICRQGFDRCDDHAPAYPHASFQTACRSRGIRASRWRKIGPERTACLISGFPADPGQSGIFVRLQQPPRTDACATGDQEPQDGLNAYAGRHYRAVEDFAAFGERRRTPVQAVELLLLQ